MTKHVFSGPFNDDFNLSYLKKKTKKNKLTPRTCRNIFHVVSICFELVLEFCLLELEQRRRPAPPPSVWAGQLKVQGQEECR